MNKIKDLNKCRDISCSYTGRLNIDKLLIIPKLKCRFNTIPTKISDFFVKINKIILQSVWKGKGTRIAKIKTPFKQKNTVIEITQFYDFLYIEIM